MAQEYTRATIQGFAVQLMYSFLTLENTNNPINFEESISSICDLPYEECDVYLKEVLLKSLKHQKEIVTYVSKFLRTWDFDRLNQVIQAILIVSVCEFYFTDEKIDKAIVINNAVKFAKKYGDGGVKDYKFVNAILENCLVNGNTDIFSNSNQ